MQNFACVLHALCTKTNRVSYQLVFLIGLRPVMCTVIKT